MSKIEGPKSNEITSVEQINHETMQEFLSKLAIWVYYEMTREEYTSKSKNDKKLLIIKYYNTLSAGVLCYLLFGFSFKFWLCSMSGFCSLSDVCMFGFCSVSSGSGLRSMIRFSPVKFDIL